MARENKSYGGLFEGMFPKSTSARTFSILFTGMGRAAQGRSSMPGNLARQYGYGDAFRGISQTGQSHLSGVIASELKKLAIDHLKPIFKTKAPYDPTDPESWNSPRHWNPPNLRDSIMRSKVVTEAASAGQVQLALRMRWYGWLTMEGRGAVVSERPIRFKLKNGQWFSAANVNEDMEGADPLYMVGPSTVHTDLLTGQSPQARMAWAVDAYYESTPYMQQTAWRIANYVADVGLALRLATASVQTVRDQTRAARQSEFQGKVHSFFPEG